MNDMQTNDTLNNDTVQNDIKMTVKMEPSRMTFDRVQYLKHSTKKLKVTNDDDPFPEVLIC